MSCLEQFDWPKVEQFGVAIGDHSKPVKAWLAQHEVQIQVFYLPSYSPELNPDERLNADLKYALGSRVQVRTKDKLRQATETHMRMLHDNPERVRSYFEDPRVSYAAEQNLVAG